MIFYKNDIVEFKREEGIALLKVIVVDEEFAVMVPLIKEEDHFREDFELVEIYSNNEYFRYVLPPMRVNGEGHTL